MGSPFLRPGGRSRVFSENFPRYIPPLFAVVVLQKVLDLHSHERIRELLFKVGKSMGKLIARRVKSNASTQSQTLMAKCCLNEMEHMGLGQSELMVFDLLHSQVVIKNANNSWAKQFKKTFGRQPEGVDFLISGVYSGILSVLLGQDCYVEEKRCISKDDAFCLFHLAALGNAFEDYFDQESIDKRLSERNLTVSRESVYSHVLIQKMFNLNQITLDKGDLRVWSIHCVMLPFDIFQIVFELLADAKSNIQNILLYFGMMQSKIAILFQVNKFGIRKGHDTFVSLLQQMELLGLGKGQLVQQRSGLVEVQLRNNSAMSQHKKMFGGRPYRPYYTVGLLLGMAKFSFDKSIKSCFIFTNKELTVKIGLARKKKDAFFDELRKSIQQRETKRTIEEKMKHQHYLTS